MHGLRTEYRAIHPGSKHVVNLCGKCGLRNNTAVPQQQCVCYKGFHKSRMLSLEQECTLLKVYIYKKKTSWMLFPRNHCSHLWNCQYILNVEETKVYGQFKPCLEVCYVRTILAIWFKSCIYGVPKGKILNTWKYDVLYYCSLIKSNV